MASDGTLAAAITFWLAAGSTYTGGAALNEDWAAAPATNTRVVGQTNFAGAAVSNAFYVTEIQWEVGSEPTTFERLSHDDELRRCRWYFRRLANNGDGIGAARFLGSGQAASSTVGICFVQFAPMHTTPTVTFSHNAHFQLWQGGSAYNTTLMDSNTDGNSPEGIRVGATIGTASLSPYGGVILRANATAGNAYIDLDADL
jgi:hypothetical protein